VMDCRGTSPRVANIRRQSLVVNDNSRLSNPQIYVSDPKQPIEESRGSAWKKIAN
jgi:hypothetical protein